MKKKEKGTRKAKMIKIDDKNVTLTGTIYELMEERTLLEAALEYAFPELIQQSGHNETSLRLSKILKEINDRDAETIYRFIERKTLYGNSKN